MVYTSIYFILFLLIVFVVTYMVHRKYRWIVFLVASCVFYILNGVYYIVYVLTTAIVTFAGTLLLEKLKDEKRKRKIVLVCIIGIVMGLLIYTKYTVFLVQNVSWLKNLKVLDVDKIILPLGISFYTFMSIGYVLDVYWKKYQPEENFFKYFAFVIYFPHIVQGPIERYNKLSCKMAMPMPYSFKRIKSGCYLIIYGFFLKLVLADRISIFVDAIFAEYGQLQGGGIWIITLALYSVQTYADFLGCMEIAQGASRILGVEIEKNFDHPYFAITLPEFWQRWHISMGAWFKDYLFFPVSNSKFVKRVSKKIGKKFGARARKNFVSCFSIAVVWLATGIWHGAGWTFLLWGIYHGVLIILSTVFSDCIGKLTAKLRINTTTYAWSIFQMARTYMLCSLGRVFFRAPSFDVAITIFKNMFSGMRPWVLMDGTLFTYGLDRADFMVVILATGVLWMVSYLQTKCCLTEKFEEQNFVFRWGILYAAILCVIIFGIYGAGYDVKNFIYGEF